MTNCKMTDEEKRDNMGRILEHDGWVETLQGWSMPSGFGKPLPLDSAFGIRSILADLDDTGHPEKDSGE